MDTRRGRELVLFILGVQLLFTYSAQATLAEKRIVVITTSYNNKEWYIPNLDSLFMQHYTNWQLIYIDDYSNDGTAHLVRKYVAHHGYQDRTILIENTERKKHLYNQYYAIHSCCNNDIIIILDGDDWFAHEHVLSRINEIYSTSDTWLTYGQFWYWKKNKKGLCKEFPRDALLNGTIRAFSWRTSHLRTFYAGLFKQIAQEDLMMDGVFFPMCADVATMFPMIEMAREHVRFIPEILYIYNDDNPLSFHHDPTPQRELEKYLRSKPPYEALTEKPY